MRKLQSRALQATISIIIITVIVLIFMGGIVAMLHMTGNTDIVHVFAAWTGRGMDSEYEEYNAPEYRYMAWPFIAYTQPCFMAHQLGNFAPQQILTHQAQDGWALIHTIYGDGWVYINADKIYTSSTIGVFEEIDGYIVRWIHPQLVRIAERQGNWFRIEDEQNPAWINLEFEPPIHILEEFVSQFGNTVSVYYENMATGFTFRHNANHVYFGASATKAPFALYIYLKTERGEACMTDIHTFTADDNWGGSGVIRHRYNFGAAFTQRQLLYLMLSPSDNIATRILRRVHGLDGYTQFVESIGANPNFVQNLTFSYLTANDAGIFMREAYRYINSGGTYSLEFRDNLLANRYPFIISDYPVASKSGWSASFGQAWHDMAIVYAPSPYVLALLSSRVGGAGDRVVYDAISMFIQEFNSTWFYPGADAP